jgi:hypothetical protein
MFRGLASPCKAMAIRGFFLFIEYLGIVLGTICILALFWLYLCIFNPDACGWMFTAALALQNPTPYLRWDTPFEIRWVLEASHDAVTFFGGLLNTIVVNVLFVSAIVLYIKHE